MSAVDAVARAVEDGAAVVIPTDTVYGLICAAGQPAAYERLSAIKGRDPHKPSTVMFARQADSGPLLEPQVRMIEVVPIVIEDGHAFAPERRDNLADHPRLAGARAPGDRR